MAEIRVTASELMNKASALRELNGNFQTQITNLETSEQTVTGMWEGEAKEEFNKYFVENKAKFDKFYQLVEKFCGAMEEIAKKYEQTEQVNVGLASTK